jgi:hypothetical protein
MEDKVAGIYLGKHRDWRGALTLAKDGTLAFKNEIHGIWELEDNYLLLRWEKYPMEVVPPIKDCTFQSKRVLLSPGKSL